MMSAQKNLYELSKNVKKTEDPEGPEKLKSTIKKRLIWQHLAQKKIKKLIKARFKI